MDYSTLNIAQLKKLPTYKLPPTYQLQREPGNGCSGDPPGYPSYFTRCVYTLYGNSPGRGTQMVISFAGVLYVVASRGDSLETQEKRLRKLWKPLPLEHPRTRAWIKASYVHNRRCYRNLDSQYRFDIIIYPVPDYQLHTFSDDPRFSVAYREAAQREIAEYNAMIEAKYKAMATPENHSAVMLIREFYPEYMPELDLIENPPEKYSGDWWETETQQPTPAQCHPRWGKHPVNITWCQFCGWQSDTLT